MGFVAALTNLFVKLFLVFLPDQKPKVAADYGVQFGPAYSFSDPEIERDALARAKAHLEVE